MGFSKNEPNSFNKSQNPKGQIHKWYLGITMKNNNNNKNKNACEENLFETLFKIQN